VDNRPDDHLRGWLVGRRDHGGVLFCDIRTGSSKTQAVFQSAILSGEVLGRVRRAPLESGFDLIGEFRDRETKQREFLVHDVASIHEADDELIRQAFPKHEGSLREEALDRYLKYRHLSIRTDYSRAASMARGRLHKFLMEWLANEEYVEIHTPILTKLPLYDDQSAISLDLHDQRLFLTQCAGFYLEAAAHAFGRVFNIGPSFRAEDSKSTRHLVEYWHVKLEAVWTSRDELMSQAEALLLACLDYVQNECQDLLTTFGSTPPARPSAPFRRIQYRDAIAELRARGHPIQFGDHIGSNEERVLKDMLVAPLWIAGSPRAVEPFPYRIDPEDKEVTITADLILPNGYGELLGVAEKITEIDELLERMREKGKDPDGAYSWVVDLRSAGCVPHAGLGMGFERLLRWLFQTHHVREFAAFPRIFGRDYSP
jgi:asparaginyl-tRNA synthetase